MAPHSSTLAWKIPWMEEPGGLHAVHGVAKSWTRLSDFTFTFHFHALEKAMALHSSTLAWKIPGMGEPGGLPSMVLQRVGHDWSDLAEAAAFSQGLPLRVVKNPPATQEAQKMWVRSLGREDPLEKGMATHSSILAWRIPWTEMPGGLQSIGSQRVGHDWNALAHTHATLSEHSFYFSHVSYILL